ncbi:MAG: hypothetical protein VB111_10755 [Clostridiaceae bacterium]|nr:hypothetical protein [Clostridiaceae bacterium]
MSVLVMDCHASDHKYLHRDFHASVDNGIRYVGEHYGDNSVRELLRRYTLAYHKPLIDAIRRDGLAKMRDYLADIYEKEEASDALSCTLDDTELTVAVGYCPGIRYMRSVGTEPSKWYIETTRTVYETIGDAVGVGFELIRYDEQTGRAAFRFFRRCF